MIHQPCDQNWIHIFQRTYKKVFSFSFNCSLNCCCCNNLISAKPKFEVGRLVQMTHPVKLPANYHQVGKVASDLLNLPHEDLFGAETRRFYFRSEKILLNLFRHERSALADNWRTIIRCHNEMYQSLLLMYIVYYLLCWLWSGTSARFISVRTALVRTHLWETLALENRKNF